MPTPRRLSKPQADALMENMAREFAAMYARIEQELLETMSRDFTRGYHSRDVSALRAEEIARLRTKTQGMLTDIRNQTPAVVERMVQVASEQGALAGLDGLYNAKFITGGAALVQSPAVMAITSELVLVANNAAQAILPSLDQFIRRAVAETVPDVLLGMATQKQVQAKIWQKSLRQGITHITDASGRNWNLATYVEMASRTATRRAFTESSIHQMGVHGVELFTPVIGRDSCKSCSYWAGKILTKGTRTGIVRVQHATNDGEFVSVKVHATVDEARSQGWQHPNCRCQLVAYIPGLSVVADSPEYDPVREGQRVKLRELERKVRAAKVDELAAVTPEQKARAKSRVRDAQAAVREHVKEADIPRRRDREQLNLGHKDKPPRARPKPVPNPNPDPAPAQKRTSMTDADLRREDIVVNKRKATPPAPPPSTPKPKTVTPRPAPVVTPPRPKVVAPRVSTPVPKVHTVAPRTTTPKATTPKKPRASASGYMAGVPKMEKPMVWGAAATNQPKVNPKYGQEIIPGNKEYSTNCSRVATAMELRARGFDVTAAAAGADMDSTKNFDSIAGMWRTSTGKVPKFTHVRRGTMTSNKVFASAPEGARFQVGGSWKRGGGHIFNAVKTDGKLVFFEGQRAGSIPEEYSERIVNVHIMRTDNLKPHEGMKDWVEWDGK